MLKRVARRLRALLRGGEVERELDEELRYHLERQVEQNLAFGMGPEEARSAALRSFGGLEQSKEACRDARGVRVVEDFAQDLRYGWRTMRKSPGFTAVAVLTLGLGVGANTAVFSAINSVLLRPLPYKDPQQLVRVWEVQVGQDQALFSPAEFLDYRAQNQSFSGMAAFRPASLTLTGAGEPEQLDGSIVSADYFSLLGVQAERGRVFHPEDGRAGARPVAVISHGLWQARFGGDATLIGRSLSIGGESVTVVGVAPPGFAGDGRQVWLNPRRVVPDWVRNSDVDLLTMRHTGYLGVLARLKPGVTLEQAQADLDTIAARLQHAYPRPVGHAARLIPLHEHVVGPVRPALLMLLGAVGLVLAVACANLASLLLARATARSQEMAIRTALGASRWRIARQLLLESALLGGLAGLVGWVFAAYGVGVLARFSSQEIPRVSEIRPDAQVFAFALGLSLFTSLLAGLAPALAASKADLHAALKDGTRGATAGGRRNRVRQALVVAEVALALVVMIGAGLLASSFTRLLAVEPGFDPRHLLTLRVGLPDERYGENEDKRRFVRELNARLEAIPGMQGVGIGDDLPIAGTYSSTRLQVASRQAASPEDLLSVGLHVITPRYFDAMGVRLIKGRTFTERDDANAPSAFIINETLARRYWPGDEPLGKRIRYNSNDPWGEVVGVVEDVKYDGLHVEAGPHLYEPYYQNPWSGLAIALRSQTDQATLLSAVREHLRALDPDLPVSRVRTMDAVLAQSLTTRRLVTNLFGLFGVSALVLVAVGLYGLLAYSVTQRTREIGVRMALGARRGDVLGLVIGQGMKLALAGVALGVAASVAAARMMETLLFGVSATDPVTFMCVSLLLVGVALVACWVPARRAVRVDPVVALRYE
jgi:putative ABC transport system permease protein